MMTIGSIKTESILPLSDGSGKQAFMTGTKSGNVVAADTIEQGVIAGERNPSSQTNAYLASVPECNITRVTTIGSDVDVSSSAPALLLGIIGEAASTTTVTLKDSATTVASLAAGAIPLGQMLDFRGAKFNTSLIINIAATGKNVLVLWRPQ